MSEVQNNLIKYDREYRTILYVMGCKKLGIDDLSIEWIADNMISQALLPASHQLAKCDIGSLSAAANPGRNDFP